MIDPVETSTDAGYAVIKLLADHHNRPFSEASARARLPQGADSRAPVMLAQLVEAAGLKARLVSRSADRLDPATLPAVLFTKSGDLLVLKALNIRERMAVILRPEAGGVEEEVSLASMTPSLRKEALLVSPETDQEAVTGHWFWSAMAANRGAWVQVALAALGLNILGLALPIFVMNVYDRVIPNLAFVTLWTLAIGVGLAIGLDWALRGLRAGLIERIGRRLDMAVSTRLFRHVLAMRPGTLPGGGLGTASILREFDLVREFFGSASLVALIDLIFIGIFVVVLWLIAGPLALVPLLAIPAMLALALAAQVPMRRGVARTQETAARKQRVMVEALTGLETVKSLGAEPAMRREWDAATAASARVSGRTRFWSNFATNSTQSIQQIVSVSLVVWGVFLIADGRISIGALIAANILSGRALAPLGAISQTIFRAQFARGALASLNNLMEAPPERVTRIENPLSIRNGMVNLQGVSYTYPGAERPALSGVNLTFTPGEITALLGKVGSGKSTLGRVIAGLTAPSEGSVLIDGQNIAQYDPAELRRAVGYLPQDPHLFTGTFGENLLLGAPGASGQEISEALSLAGIEGLVASLPGGLAHPIGPAGAHLSGGQRQGLALARLILRKPKLLFLDEPTNAMDRDMETAISARLGALAGQGIGLVLCTHRPGLANLASRLVVMDQGRVVLDGAREDVMAKLSAPRPNTGGPH